VSGVFAESSRFVGFGREEDLVVAWQARGEGSLLCVESCWGVSGDRSWGSKSCCVENVPQLVKKK